MILLVMLVGTYKVALARENLEAPVDASCERQMVVTMVKSIARGLAEILRFMPEEKERIQTIRRFIAPIRFYADESGYFYVYDLECVNIAHATQPDLQGKNLYDYQDGQGKYVIRKLAKKAKTGGGFVEFCWENPNTKEEERKIGYVEMIPGTNYFIGSGLYPGRHSALFPVQGCTCKETQQLIQFVDAATQACLS
ncbi:cache domain-containing protein [Candidatus Aerophobetes bacterium]|nr:cache domain-containing protein [Candidatus Aerophobetes bacterium]